ncbi:MAG TPA: PEP-CTERM sorting domain-containing protein [Candidatus Krumholzibacteria bacterium]|nr:PEP-CTERM sorting domain-containing protein [Candidatus Krumholzibacteria bacterium]
MRSRYMFAVSAIALLLAAPATASVISASSQTARAKPADKVDYLTVTTLQNDMNASMRGVADANAPSALGTASVPSSTSGGFLIGVGGSSVGTGGITGGGIEPILGSNSNKGGVGNNDGHHNDWSFGRGQGNNNGGKDKDKDKDDEEWHHGGGGANGVQAAPEPSTWLLLGTGLALAGAFTLLRRNSL